MKQTTLKWIYNYAKKDLWAILLLAAIGGSIVLSFILLALVSSSLLDIAAGTKNGSIVIQCIFIAGLILLQGALNVIGSNVRMYASGKIEIKIKEDLFSALIKKEYLQITKIHSGEILNRLTSDLQIVTNGIVSIIPEAISLSTKFLVSFFVLSKICFMFTPIIMVSGVIMFIFSKLYGSKVKYLHKECQESDGKTRSFIQECIGNIIVIKAFSNWIPVMNKFSQFQSVNYKAKVKRNAVSSTANTLVYLLLTSGYFLILVWGAIQISSNTMSFGELIALLQIIEQIKVPFRTMPGLSTQYHSMLASADRLRGLDELKNERSAEFGTKDFDTLEVYRTLRYINFENVSFGYNSKKILDGINLSINKGDILAIAGTSGAGKSTLIKLLLGLIYPDSGNIYVHTAKKRFKIYNATRSLFAYVPQTNMILSGTIRENISFFNPSVSENQIIQALKTACIWDFIEKLPDNLDTLLGERGSGLSEGQIQRLAIARAILSDAPILLLDECTSALDEVTEVKVLNNIKSLATKTIIYISHKAATISSCDRIIHIENGKLDEYAANEKKLNTL